MLKIGTKVKNIRLVEGDHNIDCKIDGFGPMKLKSEFVKRTNSISPAPEIYFPAPETAAGINERIYFAAPPDYFPHVAASRPGSTAWSGWLITFYT